MVTRASLHELLDALPEDRLAEAGRLLIRLIDDPVLRALVLAPEDDEAVTPEQAAILDRRCATVRGRTVSDEEAARRLGL
jgi:hypothetical protein